MIKLVAWFAEGDLLGAMVLLMTLGQEGAWEKPELSLLSL